MTSQLKLYRIRESAYGKEKDYRPADVYVAATSHPEALRIFGLNYGEPESLTVSLESLPFLLNTAGSEL